MLDILFWSLLVPKALYIIKNPSCAQIEYQQTQYNNKTKNKLAVNSTIPKLCLYPNIFVYIVTTLFISDYTDLVHCVMKPIMTDKMHQCVDQTKKYVTNASKEELCQ